MQRIFTLKNFNQKGLAQILLLGLIAAVLIAGLSFGYVKYFGSDKTDVVGNVKTNLSNVSQVKIDSVPQAHAIFGFNILNKLYNEAPEENIFISPTSIALALSMAYNGSGGETKEEMAKVLAISDISLEKLNQETQNLIVQYKDIDPKVEIALANSIWTRSGFEPKESFIKTLGEWYAATAKALDFNKQEAIDEINNWVKKNTKDKIESIVDYPISRDVIMYLINATYFKGIWTDEFNPENTKERSFYDGDNIEKKHDFMYRHDDFSYLENNDFQAVRLPYGENERLNMYVFLPKDNLKSFINKLNYENWNNWMVDFKSKEGNLYLPKIKIEYEKNLNEYLKSLGMNLAFTGQANFENIDRNILISRVLHKTFVEVNEEGTEAAAVTAIDVGRGYVEPEEIFSMEVNKPYFFVIRDDEIGENLFMGVINNPEY